MEPLPEDKNFVFQSLPGGQLSVYANLLGVLS